MTIIVTYIRRERRKWGLTQQQVADLVGVTTSAHISALERGRTRPSAEVLLAFQLLFGMTAAQLFPQLVQQVEQKALKASAAILKATTPDATLRASRTTTLLKQISTRAVMS
jgi:transcriptional regulator with XRE-family HTH domain